MKGKKGNEKSRIVVIGGGPAAITLAKNLGDSYSLTVIRPEDHSMIYCAMPYAIEGLLPAEKTLKADSLVSDTGAQLLRDRVETVDFDAKKISTRSGQVLAYDKLVIATGADPVLPPITGVNLEGVTVFKREEEMYRIADMVDKGIEEAVVVGAGAIGVELAQALAARNVKTTLVDMAGSVLSNLADPEMTGPAMVELENLGISLKLGRMVKALQPAGETGGTIAPGGAVPGETVPKESSLDGGPWQGSNRVGQVQLDDGTTIDTDLVVFAVGMKPALELFQETNLEMVRDGIVIDSRMRTNREDVYAIGDCTSFFSGITGERTGGKLATNAVPMARVLAANLKGEEREYDGFFNGAATKAGELFIGGVGLKEQEARERFDVIVGYSEFTTTFPIMPGAKKVKVKLIAERGNGKILGGQIVSGAPLTDKVDQITLAIQFGITAEQLLGFSYASQPWQSFYPAHNLLVKASESLVKQMEMVVEREAV